MKPPSLAALIVIMIGSIVVSGCAVGRPPVENRPPRLTVPSEHQAWNAARIRLHSMCPAVPRTEAELTRALLTRQPNDCYVRFAKDTHLPMNDDWHWHWLPPYRVVAAVHDEELRKHGTHKHYEEYISALNRYLAEKADRGQITPAQFRYVFNAGWNWLSTKVENERFLMQETLNSGAGFDPAMRSALNNVAGELATITTLALAVSAQDKRYEPIPASCYALFGDERSYTIQCY
jgi:hypothetical protein